MKGWFLKLFGRRKVEDKVKAAIENRRLRIVSGLMEIGLLVQGKAQTMVPVEYGILRASAYTRRSMENELQVEVGFSADYALYVHENMQVHAGDPRPSGIGVFWGPAGEPKYLEKARNIVYPNIKSIMEKHLKK